MSGVEAEIRAHLPELLLRFTVAVAAMFLSEHYGAPVMLMALLLGSEVEEGARISGAASIIGPMGLTLLFAVGAFGRLHHGGLEGEGVSI